MLFVLLRKIFRGFARIPTQGPRNNPSHLDFGTHCKNLTATKSRIYFNEFLVFILQEALKPVFGGDDKEAIKTAKNVLYPLFLRTLSYRKSTKVPRLDS